MGAVHLAWKGSQLRPAHLCDCWGKLILTRSVRQMQPSYDPRLHDVVKDRPYDHPGFLAGSVGRSKPQKAREVQDQGEVLPGQPVEQPLEPPSVDISPPADRLGNVSPLVMPPSCNPKSPSRQSSVASLSTDSESDGGDDDCSDKLEVEEPGPRTTKVSSMALRLFGMAGQYPVQPQRRSRLKDQLRLPRRLPIKLLAFPRFRQASAMMLS